MTKAEYNSLGYSDDILSEIDTLLSVSGGVLTGIAQSVDMKPFLPSSIVLDQNERQLPILQDVTDSVFKKTGFGTSDIVEVVKYSIDGFYVSVKVMYSRSVTILARVISVEMYKDKENNIMLSRTKKVDGGTDDMSSLPINESELVIHVVMVSLEVIKTIESQAARRER